MIPQTEHSPPEVGPGIDPISACYQWDPDEMAEALSAHSRHQLRPALRVFLCLILGVYPLGTILIPLIQACSPENAPEYRWTMATAAFLVALFWYWVIVGIHRKTFLRWRTRRIFRSNPAGGGLAEWSFGPDEISVRTPLVASALLWPLFMKVVETPRGFLLYQNTQLFHWVPGHAFRTASEMARFSALARSRVEKYAVLGGCQFVGKPGTLATDEV